jgi:hypothetical protein
MSNLVGRLHQNMAFKPAPSLWELAGAHVPFGELGVETPPEPRVRGGLEEGDGLVVLTGESGSGKSSVLAHVASELSRATTETESPRRYLPIFVPVASRTDVATDLAAFGRATAREVLLALRGGLPPEYRDRLERLMADTVTAQQTGAPFNVKIGARILGTGGEVALDLARDVVTLAGAEVLDNRGGLRTLCDFARARGYELIVIVEDTDAWAVSDEGLSLARAFFSTVLRPLVNEVDVAVAVAAHTRWSDVPELVDVLERAVSAPVMPAAQTPDEGAGMVAKVLARRIERALDEPHPVGSAFTDEAIQMLGHQTWECRGLRRPLTRVRDAFDRHADALPERIGSEHLLDTF